MIKISLTILLLSIINLNSAVWLPKEPLNLGVHLTAADNASMITCYLKNSTYVSVYSDTVSKRVTHFTWTEAGQKSDLRTFELSLTMSLLCLKNGQYLIVSYGPDFRYDNYTFRFFNEDGSLTKIFSFNDTIYQFISRISEMSDGNILMTPKKPSEKNNYTAPLLILDKNGNILKRKVIDFNIPAQANKDSTPIFYTFLRTAVNENNQIILGTFHADWERDLSFSSTDYFPKRIYYNLTILDANLAVIKGPTKTYVSLGLNEFGIIPMGSGNFAFIAEDNFNHLLNISFYDLDFQLVGFDSIQLSSQQFLYSYPVSTSEQGIVALGQGIKGAYWQRYNKNGIKKGEFVTLGDDFLFLSNVQLDSNDDFGLVYLRNDFAYFAKGVSFLNYANFSYMMKVSCIILVVLFSIF